MKRTQSKTAGTASHRGQVNIEITFSFIVVMMLILGMIKVFYWVSDDLTARRVAHENSLIEWSPAGDINDNYRQIRPVFYESSAINGVVLDNDFFKQ